MAPPTLHAGELIKPTQLSITAAPPVRKVSEEAQVLTEETSSKISRFVSSVHIPVIIPRDSSRNMILDDQVISFRLETRRDVCMDKALTNRRVSLVLPPAQGSFHSSSIGLSSRYPPPSPPLPSTSLSSRSTSHRNHSPPPVSDRSRFQSTSRPRSSSPPTHPASSAPLTSFSSHPRRQQQQQQHQWDSFNTLGGASGDGAFSGGPPQLSLALPQRPNFSPSGSRRFNDHRDRERSASGASPLNPNLTGSTSFSVQPHSGKPYTSSSLKGRIGDESLGRDRDLVDGPLRERGSGGVGGRRRDWHGVGGGPDSYRDRDGDSRGRPPRLTMYEAEAPKVEWDYYE